ASERLLLREKTVPGMHGVSAGFFRGLEDAIDPKVAVARRAAANRVGLVRQPHVERGPVALGVHGYRRNAHLAARTTDPDGDFAAVSDQNLLHGGFYCSPANRRNLPTYRLQSGILPCFFGGFLSRLFSRFLS